MIARNSETAAENTTNGQIRARAREENCRLEPHVCKVCFARIASTATEDGGRLYQCTNCGLSGHDHKPGVICACGIKIRKHKGDGRSAVTMVDAGIRCHENRARSPEFPSLYTASFGGVQAEPDC